MTDYIVDNHRSGKNANGGEDKVDHCDDKAFCKENSEYVVAPRANGPQDADFLFLIRNTGADKVGKHQRCEQSKAETDVQEHVCQRVQDIVYCIQFIGDRVFQFKPFRLAFVSVAVVYYFADIFFVFRHLSYGKRINCIFAVCKGVKLPVGYHRCKGHVCVAVINFQNADNFIPFFLLRFKISKGAEFSAERGCFQRLNQMLRNAVIILHTVAGYDFIAVVVVQNFGSDDDFVIRKFCFFSVNPGDILILHQIQSS